MTVAKLNKETSHLFIKITRCSLVDVRGPIKASKENYGFALVMNAFGFQGDAT